MAERSVTRARAYLDHVLAARGVRLDDVPVGCVITHSKVVLERAIDTWPRREIDIGTQRAFPVYLFTPPGRAPFGMVSGCQGAPMAAAALEELVALGFERFGCVGTAGHPTHDLPARLDVGDVVLVDRALVYEGTTAHYAPADEVAPDPELRRALADALDRRGIRWTAGTVATTDALYRETPGFLAAALARGATALDMELSALFSVARFRGVSIAAVLVVSDLVPIGAPWEPGFASEALRTAEGSLLDVVLDAVAP